MANIIAVIWDCDKTLIDGYMQDPIFKDYNIDAGKFWAEVNSVPAKLAENNIRVNRDTYYLNHFIKCAHDGTFPGLSNQKLREYGAKQKFYKGIPQIFQKTKSMFKDDKSYAEYASSSSSISWVKLDTPMLLIFPFSFRRLMSYSVR